MSETQQQEKPLHELLSRSMVDIYVGSENTHWVLHEKLLCHHSPFFRDVFYKKERPSKTFGLPEEEDAPFKTFVGWLYSSTLPVPREEADLGLLFELYLMSEKFKIPALIQDILQTVREWYKFSDTYPGLRRVQYIYANTEEGSPMRHMLVHAVARMLVLEKSIPAHWDKALKKNGQLAVDIIKAIQDWRLEDELVPDAREEPEDAEELVELDEETVVESPGGTQQTGEVNEAKQNGEQNETKQSEEVKETKQNGDAKTNQGKGSKRVDSLVGETEKLGLKELPNGVLTGDYGTVH